MRAVLRSVKLRGVQPEKRSGPTYAVTWHEGDGPIQAGKLEVGPARLRLEGGTSGRRISVQTVLYEDFSTVRMARAERGRESGPALLLERRGRPALWIASVDGAGTAREFFERLAAAVGHRAAA